MKKKKSIFVLAEQCLKVIYDDTSVAEIQSLTDNDGTLVTAESILSQPERYADVEIIFSGWGAPVMDAKILEALPNLKAFFYGAGSVRYLVSDAFWQRNILLTSAYEMNAIPVAEYTTASIIFALKQAWNCNRRLIEGKARLDITDIAGAYRGTKVGIISLGAIGRLVCAKLSNLELDVCAYDPFAPDSVFEAHGARKLATLEEIFSLCDVVTLHAPWLPVTEGMVTGTLLRLMRNGATFINTARGAIVDEAAMIEVLQERPDLFAVIDVITDESRYESSPLATLPNVFLTPHIAGSLGRECRRMGDRAVQECRRYLNGEEPLSRVSRENINRMA